MKGRPRQSHSVNKYLAWAFVEAANLAQRYDTACRRFYDRKKAQVNGIVATKALACKLSAWLTSLLQRSRLYLAFRVQLSAAPLKQFGRDS